MRLALLAGPQRGWARVPPAVRSRGGPAMLGALAAIGLLLAFYGVVREAVVQGELRRAASAAQAAAAWRCARAPQAQADCMAMRVEARANEPANSLARSDAVVLKR